MSNKNALHKTAHFIVIILCLVNLSCKKYLIVKPDQSIATPASMDDLEGILNNYTFINARYPSASEVSSDSYYLTDADWGSLIEPQRDYYIWQKYDSGVGDYLSPYLAIEYVNIILDSLPNIPSPVIQQKNEIQGNALFIRASYHYAVAQLFAKPYDKTTANSDLEIALRLTSDIQVKPVRSTVVVTYNSILADLQQAVSLLPANSDLKYKASKPAAYGMLSRVYLSMSDYSHAGQYADSALNLYNKLRDYNSVSASAAIPFKQFNDEVIYDARTTAPQALSASKAKIDTTLFASYALNDLRKTILFKVNANGSRAFKGSYTGLSNASLFTGIATNELYLIKAEAAARNDNASMALQSLNTLLATRWKKGSYVPYVTTDTRQLLGLILQERRKDLLFRTLRWTDLRRLNKEADYTSTIVRKLDQTTYTLVPASLRYVFEINQSAVSISELEQNP